MKQMKKKIHRSERYSFSTVGSTSFKRMQIVSTLSALSKGSHRAALFRLAGQVSRPVAGKVKYTFGGIRRVCATKQKHDTTHFFTYSELYTTVLDIWTDSAKVIPFDGYMGRQIIGIDFWSVGAPL